MEIAVILLAAIVATTMMTAFSYLMSAAFRELYKEPLLLQYLMTRFHFELSGSWRVAAGWVVHYGIGLFFVLAYYILWRWNLHDITWISALIYGMIIGIIGIGGWVIMFNLSNYKPRIDFKGYYLQLFFAHIIFAMGTFIIFYLLLK